MRKNTIAQVLIFAIAALATSFLFPGLTLSTGVVFYLGEPLEKAGIINLVNAGGVDGASIISATLYWILMISIGIIAYMITKNKIYLIAFSLISLFFSVIVFVLTSSALWF